jgi:hypothetical protein
MIWFNHTGPSQPVGSAVGTSTIDGKSFTVWEGSSGQNNVVSYVANSPITSLNNVNVWLSSTTRKPLSRWLIRGIEPASKRALSRGAAVSAAGCVVSGRSGRREGLHDWQKWMPGYRSP